MLSVTTMAAYACAQPTFPFLEGGWVHGIYSIHDTPCHISPRSLLPERLMANQMSRRLPSTGEDRL
jgi:hypothetical protein